MSDNRGTENQALLNNKGQINQSADQTHVTALRGGDQSRGTNAEGAFQNNPKVNADGGSDANSSLIQSQVQAKQKKKRIIIISAIALGVIVIILAIVLPLTLVKDEEENRPKDDLQEHNPYKRTISSQSDFLIEGTLDYNEPPKAPTPTILEQTMSFFQTSPSADGRIYKPVELEDIKTGVNNQLIKKANFRFALINNKQAKLTISDSVKPLESVPREHFPRIVEEFEARFSQVGLQFANETDPFWFSFGDIYRDNAVIITTKLRKLFLYDKFLEIGFKVPTKRIFGIGTSNRQFLLTNGSYTMYAKGRDEDVTDDSFGGKSTNGVHPFLLCQTEAGDFFGIYFMNSAAQQIEILYFEEEVTPVINYQTLGGNLEIYFLMRGTAQEVLQMYHKIIGLPMMPPFFALGFYQGSDSFDSVAKIQNSVDSYTGALTPIEGVTLDNYQDSPFSLKKEMEGLAAYISGLQSGGRKAIIDAPHKLHTNSTIYKDIETSKALIQDGSGAGGHFMSNGEAYIDWMHENAMTGYSKGIDKLRELGFDGLTLTNNWIHTPNCNGQCKTTMNKQQQLDSDSIQNMNEEGQQGQHHPQLGKMIKENKIGNTPTYLAMPDQSAQSTYNLPIIPGGKESGHLDVRTINLNATNKLGNQAMTQYYVHNMNGHLQLKLVNQALSDKGKFQNKRPFILSGSTFPGSGKFGGTWVGNNARTWDNLRTAIAQVMNLNLFGISVSGANVCGDYGMLDEELCIRWLQATVLFPLQRNYYSAKAYFNKTMNQSVPTTPSEFANFKDKNNSVIAHSTITQRYSLLRYIYSQLYLVYREGGAVVKPLFFDYPMDNQAFNRIEDTYMIGDAIKVSPCLVRGVAQQGGEYESYFPAGVWADLNNIDTKLNVTVGRMEKLKSGPQTNLHLRAGSIIPFQENPMTQYKTTQDFQNKLSTTFIIMRDQSQRAEGQCLIDDGKSLDSYEKDDYTMWKIRYAQKSVSFWVQYGNFKYQPPQDYKIHKLEKIVILHAEDLADSDFACYMQKDISPINMSKPLFDPITKTLTLSTLGNTKVQFNQIGFIKFGNSAKEPNFCRSDQAFTYEVESINARSDNFINVTLKSRLNISEELLEKLHFTAYLLDDKGTLNVNITNRKDDKYKIEYAVDHNRFKGMVGTAKLDDYLEVSAVGQPFAYTYKNKKGEPLYKTNPNKFYLTKFLIFDQGQFDISANDAVFGIGERAGHLFYRGEQGGIHTRYTLDQANPVDDGVPPGRNMYGYQPFYMYQHVSKAYVGVLELNSYATDYILYQTKTQNNITNIMIGGQFQKYFFQSDKPDQAISAYQRLVGFPAMPPFWAFGWQQCRFGYVNDAKWMAVYRNYTTFNLPLDVMWADIDYMDDYKLFTISKSSYPNLPTYVNEVKKDGRRFVPIMDPGVAIRKNYNAYSRGKELNIFIKTSDAKEDLIGGSWCGDSVFPDFHHPNSTMYWTEQWQDLNNQLNGQIDGIWIDVNEATNKCNGYCHPEKQRPTNSLRNMAYYVPGQRDLEDQALGVDGLHADKNGVYDPINGVREYDVHNLYGLMQVKASYEYLKTRDLRPYVLTRSNYPGIGKWGHHWLADNWSTVEYMKLSVYGLYGYSVFGIPFIGSDICGFNGDALPDLCTRWHQLGAFYPFSRNHNQNATAAQEPFVFNITWQGSITYTDLIRTALNQRYSLIMYYYSQFYEMSLVGGSFWKPLFFEYPNDPAAYNDIEINILLGNALKLSMETRVLPSVSTKYYFPEGYWCQILPKLDGACIDSDGSQEKGNITFPSALADYQLHLRGGHILPVQIPLKTQFMKTADLINNPVDFYIVADRQGQANGFIYYDDGIKFEVKYDKFDLKFQRTDINKASLTFTLKDGKARQTKDYEQVGMIKILNTDKAQLAGVKNAQVNIKGQPMVPAPVIQSEPEKSLTITLSSEAGRKFNIYEIDSIILLP